MTFDEYVDEVLGEDDAMTDIIAVIRRCWFYDFLGYPTRVWQGQGKLFTSDGNVWLGTIDGNGVDYHVTPKIQDGRDGSSPTLQTTLNLIDMPGQTARELYDAIKADQSLAAGRKLTCYIVAVKPGEGIRASIPVAYLKEFTMMSVRFSEGVSGVAGGVLMSGYKASVILKDGNFGRSEIPNGTYADTIQKERANERGVTLDRGCEFLAKLANRTYTAD